MDRRAPHWRLAPLLVALFWSPASTAWAQQDVPDARPGGDAPADAPAPPADAPTNAPATPPDAPAAPAAPAAPTDTPAGPTDAPAAPNAPTAPTAPTAPIAAPAAPVDAPASADAPARPTNTAPPAPADTPEAATAEPQASASDAATTAPAIPSPQPPITEPREVPDYDGRADGVGFGEVALWVPRILVSPLYLVSEFVVRRPLGWLISTAEEEKVAEKLVDVFTFGDDAQFALVPTAYVDLGFRPRFGLYGRWSDMGVEGNKLKLNATVSTFDQFRVSVGDAYAPEGSLYSLSASNTYGRADDRRFYGSESNDATKALSTGRVHYSVEDNRLSGRLGLNLWRSSAAGASVGVHSVTFDDKVRTGTPVTDPGNAFAPPPGYTDGYTALQTRLSAALDTRRPRPYPGDGLRLTGSAEYSTDLRSHGAGQEAPQWMTYGGLLGGYLDLTDTNHVVGLVAHVELTQKLQGVVPFTELVDIGGSGPLKGFIPGRLYGDSAAALVLEYRYPVWIWLDGSIHGALGNVFPGYLEGFEVGELRHSIGMSLRTVGDRDHSFDFTVALGGKPVGDGGAIEAARLVIGGNSAF